MKLIRNSVLVCMAVLTLAGCDEEEERTTGPIVRPVLTTVVGDVEGIRLAIYPGRAIAAQELNIAFEVPGRMLARPVDVGTEVAAGSVLATLDPAPFQAQIRALEGQRAALVATLDNAQTELGRQEELLREEFASQAAVDNQEAVVKSTAANLEAVEGSLDSARLNLEYATLIAPFEATVSETFIESFQNVNARQPVMRLLDTSRIKMEIAVPENLIRLEPFVEQIEVEFSSFPGNKIIAEIVHVGNEASASTRTYPVTILMDQPEGAPIQPGMAARATATVRLPDDWSKRGIEVPTAAVFSPNKASPDETFIWVVDPDSMTVSPKPVTIRSFAERGLLVNGLQAGDRIVTAGANSLTDGQQVRLHGKEE